MSVESVVVPVDLLGVGNIQCWCCDTVDAPGRMVHLGNHPQVHLCLRCAHFVHQQAWEIENEDKQGPVVLVRERLRTLRALAMRGGWDQDGFIGGTICQLGRFFP